MRVGERAACTTTPRRGDKPRDYGARRPARPRRRGTRMGGSLESPPLWRRPTVDRDGACVRVGERDACTTTPRRGDKPCDYGPRRPVRPRRRGTRMRALWSRRPCGGAPRWIATELVSVSASARRAPPRPGAGTSPATTGRVARRGRAGAVLGCGLFVVAALVAAPRRWIATELVSVSASARRAPPRPGAGTSPATTGRVARRGRAGAVLGCGLFVVAALVAAPHGGSRRSLCPCRRARGVHHHAPPRGQAPRLRGASPGVAASARYSDAGSL